MTTPVKHLRSATANKRPTASGLANGRLAINTASGTPGLYFLDSASGVVKVGPAHVGSTAPNAAPAGASGNSIGELWVDNATTTAGLKYYTGSAFVNLTPSGTATTVGLVELATNAETQTGTDAVRAVTPAGLQSKVSDSTSTTSSSGIASSTAVKAAYDLAGAALPKAGGRVTGNLEIGPAGSLSFEGSTDDNFETTLAVVNPTADRTITFPNVTGTVITTGDSGTVNSTMILDGTIVNADINASAAIALSKLATGALPTGITVSSGNIVDGTIMNADVNASAAIAGTKIAPDFGSQAVATTGDITIGDKIIHAGDTNTAIRFPSADTVAIETNGSECARIDSSGKLLVGTSTAYAGSSNINAHLQLHGTTSSESSWQSTRWSTDSSAPINNIQKSRGASVGTRGVVTSGDSLGRINYAGDDGTNFITGVTIEAAVDGTPGTDDMPGRLVFSTTADGSAFPTERMRIDSAGTTTLTSAAATAPFIAKINTTEVARIDSSGKLLVGTSSTRVTAGITPFIQLEGTSGGASSQSLTRNSSDSGAPFLNLAKTRGTTIGSFDIVSNDDAIGQISFSGADGAALIRGAQILAAVDGTPGADDMPGRLVFSTTPNGSTSPAERMRIDSAGNVGINTTSPSTRLYVADTSAGSATIARTNASVNAHIAYTTTAGTVYAGQGSSLSFVIGDSTNLTATSAKFAEFSATENRFFTSGSERARIDSSGRLLVGTSTSRGQGGFTPSIQLEGTTASDSSLGLIRNSTAASANFTLGRARGSTIGSLTAVIEDDILGNILFTGSNGTDLSNIAASISVAVDGIPNTGADTTDLPGRLVFSTTANGSGSPTERMRINNAGELLVGYTSDNGAYKLQVNSQIFATSATVATSDGRFKENIATLNGCFNLVKALRPVSFTWKPQEDITRIDDENNEVMVREGHNFPEGTQVGFIAQEVQEALEDEPWLSSVIKENIRPAVLDADGEILAPEEQFFGIAEGNLIAVLTNALQEAIAKIETLEQRLTDAGIA